MNDAAASRNALFLERGDTCGNRFALLDCRGAAPPSLDALRRLAVAVCGDDGDPPADDLLVVVAPDGDVPELSSCAETGADARLVIVGADGRVADLCGNGLLYAAAVLARDTPRDDVVVESVRGLHRAHRAGGAWSATLETPRRLPGEAERVRRALGLAPGSVSALDSGEPHVVITAACLGLSDPRRRVSARLAERLGAVALASPVDGGVNVDLVSCEADGTLRIRTWERGVRRWTESCGTGAAAAAWAVARDRLRRGDEVSVAARGGAHRVRLDRRRLRIAASPRRASRTSVAALLHDVGTADALRTALAGLVATGCLPAGPPATSCA